MFIVCVVVENQMGGATRAKTPNMVCGIQVFRHWYVNKHRDSNCYHPAQARRTRGLGPEEAGANPSGFARLAGSFRYVTSYG